MLFLNEGDIQEAVGPADVLERVESIFRHHATGDFLMPPRMQVASGDDVLLLMPCFLRDRFGTKMVTVFPGNSGRGKPVVNALMVLNDALTAEPLAILNGRRLTALRTGAVGGVGVKWLSPKTPHTLGLIGAGVQGFEQVRSALATGAVNRVLVYDLFPEKLPDFVVRLSAAAGGVPCASVATPEALLAEATSVIVATTSKEPVLPDDPKLLENKSFVGIGSFTPEMREFPEALFRMLDKVIVDTEHALIESGDLITPLEKGWIDKSRIQTMGRYLTSGESPDERRGRTTLFKSVGMGLLDVGVAALIVERAGAMGLGTELTL